MLSVEAKIHIKQKVRIKSKPSAQKEHKYYKEKQNSEAEPGTENKKKLLSI